MRKHTVIVIAAIGAVLVSSCAMMKRKISEQIANQLIESGGDLSTDRGFVGKAYVAIWTTKMSDTNTQYTAYSTLTLEFLSDKEVILKIETTLSLEEDETTETYEETLPYKSTAGKMILSPGTDEEWTMEIRTGSFVTTVEPLIKFYQSKGYACKDYIEALIFSEI